MGRGKVQLKRIENPISRQVTFSKRKAGLLKKASELSLLCDAEVALIIFSPAEKLYDFASPSMTRIMEKHQKISASTGHCIQLSENVEILHLEMERLKNTMAQLEKISKKLIGEDLNSLCFEDLLHFEKQLNLSARKICSKKHKLLLHDIGSLKTKQRALKEENANLLKKLGRSHKAANKNVEIMEGANGKLETEGGTHQNLYQLTLNLSLS